jgi:hypothetical protein
VSDRSSRRNIGLDCGAGWSVSAVDKGVCAYRGGWLGEVRAEKVEGVVSECAVADDMASRVSAEQFDGFIIQRSGA